MTRQAGLPVARIVLAVVLVLTLARVFMTHRVFSHTSDEPWHLAGGYDVLVKRSWTTDLHHPPLSRVFFALPFIGTPEPEAKDAGNRGIQLMLRNDRYTQNVARARLGNLVFLALGIIAVFRWGSYVLSPIAGATAAALFAMLPPVLAHGGLATTDMAAAATVALAMDALTRYVDGPTWRRAVYLGIAVALGILAKYSFFVYFPAIAAALLIARFRSVRNVFTVKTVVAMVITVAVVWLGFGCDFQPLIDGVKQVRDHNKMGHRAFLFEEMRWGGWWYYFPVALAVKTPIPFLLLALVGCILLARRRPDVPLIALAILGAAMTSHINIGVRHVLPIYGPLAICAAAAVIEWRRLRAVSAVLVLWLFVDGVRAHPDYLPWFNAFAPEPEKVLNDSNLDWGQDILRLVRLAKKEKIEFMTISLFTNADLDRIGFPKYEKLTKMQQIEGWFAISEMQLAIGYSYGPELHAWLDRLLEGQPYRRVGKSIRLYYFGPNHPPE